MQRRAAGASWLREMRRRRASARRADKRARSAVEAQTALLGRGSRGSDKDWAGELWKGMAACLHAEAGVSEPRGRPISAADGIRNTFDDD